MELSYPDIWVNKLAELDNTTHLETPETKSRIIKADRHVIFRAKQLSVKQGNDCWYNMNTYNRIGFRNLFKHYETHSSQITYLH